MRGVAILERIVAYSNAHSDRGIELHLIDPGEPWQYSTRQPDYMLLNIVCGQVSLFPDQSSVPNKPVTAGPNFLTWLRERGLRIAVDGFSVSQVGREVQFGDFAPRRLMGEYLVWVRDFLIRTAPSVVRIVHHVTHAIDAIIDPSTTRVILKDGTVIDADHLVLTFGYGQPWPPGGEGGEPLAAYPLPAQIEGVGAGHVLALNGVGLAAIDVILALTVGRGGRFETTASGTTYLPSGKEPRIVAFSRSGLPFRARPALGAPVSYEPVVFTAHAIDNLRAEAQHLDFDEQVLPLLLTELRIAYRRARRGIEAGWDAAADLLDELRRAHVSRQLEPLLDELDQREGRFDAPASYFGARPGVEDLASAKAYRRWFLGRVENDLLQADRGVAADAEKAAIEVCREFRETIRRAVDFEGLTDASARRFFNEHAAALNRLGVGPQKERHADLLALAAQGIVDLPLGPAPDVIWDAACNEWCLSSTSLAQRVEVRAGWLIDAYVERGGVNERGAFTTALMSRGMIVSQHLDDRGRPGLRLDRSHRPITESGEPSERLYVLGLLCDGTTFYNGHLPAAGRFDRSIHDADEIVRSILAHEDGPISSNGQIPFATRASQ